MGSEEFGNKKRTRSPVTVRIASHGAVSVHEFHCVAHSARGTAGTFRLGRQGSPASHGRGPPCQVCHVHTPPWRHHPQAPRLAEPGEPRLRRYRRHAPRWRGQACLRPCLPDLRIAEMIQRSFHRSALDGLHVTCSCTWLSTWRGGGLARAAGCRGGAHGSAGSNAFNALPIAGARWHKLAIVLYVSWNLTHRARRPARRLRSPVRPPLGSQSDADVRHRFNGPLRAS